MTEANGGEALHSSDNYIYIYTYIYKKRHFIPTKKKATPIDPNTTPRINL